MFPSIIITWLKAGFPYRIPEGYSCQGKKLINIYKYLIYLADWSTVISVTI